MKFIVIVLISLCIVCINADDGIKRTWSGSHIDMNKVNFIVSLAIERADKVDYCTGVLLNPQWILSSASCFAIPPKALQIKYQTNGSALYLRIELPKDADRLSKIIKIHPYFTKYSDFHRYDIVLIKLPEPLERLSVNTRNQNKFMFIDIEEKQWPIDIKKEPIERVCTLYGFGKNVHNDMKLHATELVMQYGRSCECFVGSPYGLCSKLTTDTENDTPCYGDWGGPLICSGALVGIFSNLGRCSNQVGPLHCGEKYLISGFTYIKPYIPWINDKMGDVVLTVNAGGETFKVTEFDVSPPFIDNAEWEKKELQKKEKLLETEINLWENNKEQWYDESNKMDIMKIKWEERTAEWEKEKQQWKADQREHEGNLVNLKQSEIEENEKKKKEFNRKKLLFDSARKEWDEEFEKWQHKRLDWLLAKQKLDFEKSKVIKRLDALSKRTEGTMVRSMPMKPLKSSTSMLPCNHWLIILTILISLSNNIHLE